MAEIVRLFGKREFGLAAFQLDRSAGQMQEPCNQAQQRRLAHAVGADHRQRLAGDGPELEAGKHLPAAPHAS